MMSATRNRTAAIAALAAAAFALPFAASPAAAAGEARATMSVSARVLPGCRVAQEPAAGPRADIACSSGTSFSTMTATREAEQPLDQAAAILGRPVRDGGAIRFTSAVQPAAAAGEGAGASGTRYLTVTY